MKSFSLIIPILILLYSAGCKKDDNYDPTTRGKVTDIDGNVYNTDTIGTQIWMKENLKTTKYRNGDLIPNVTVKADWSTLTSGAYCWFNNDSTVNKATYGALYNWYAVSDSRNIAPKGWHVPTDAEWKVLEVFLGMTSAEADIRGWRGTNQGCKLKEMGSLHWQYNNTTSTNSSGFTALPGNRRDQGGVFPSDRLDVGWSGYWWSATENDSSSAWDRQLHSNYDTEGRSPTDKRFGFSIRCVKD